MERNVSEKLSAIIAAAAEAGQPKVKEVKNGTKKPKGGNHYVIHDETKIREKLSKQGLFILMALMNAGEKGLTKKGIQGCRGIWRTGTTVCSRYRLTQR
jgi:hypothetical protein